MLDSALGLMMAIGLLVLAAALIYAVLHVRHRSRRLNSEREQATRRLYTDERAQDDNLKSDAGIGQGKGHGGARPPSPTPNDIT